MNPGTADVHISRRELAAVLDEYVCPRLIKRFGDGVLDALRARNDEPTDDASRCRALVIDDVVIGEAPGCFVCRGGRSLYFCLDISWRRHHRAKQVARLFNGDAGVLSDGRGFARGRRKIRVGACGKHRLHLELLASRIRATGGNIDSELVHRVERTHLAVNCAAYVEQLMQARAQYVPKKKQEGQGPRCVSTKLFQVVSKFSPWNTPGCFVCSGNERDHPSIAFACSNMKVGNAIAKMFNSGAVCEDFKEDGVWVTVGACEEHCANLTHLCDVVLAEHRISTELVREVVELAYMRRTEKPESVLNLETMTFAQQPRSDSSAKEGPGQIGRLKPHMPIFFEPRTLSMQPSGNPSCFVCGTSHFSRYALRAITAHVDAATMLADVFLQRIHFSYLNDDPCVTIGACEEHVEELNAIWHCAKANRAITPQFIRVLRNT